MTSLILENDGQDPLVGRAIAQSHITDWYAMNPVFLSGTCVIPVALPEVRCGHRVRLATEKKETTTQCYVEGVDIRIVGIEASAAVRSSTTLTLTRGWTGDDSGLVAALQQQSGEFAAEV